MIGRSDARTTALRRRFEATALVHLDALRRTAIHLTKDPCAAEDLVQDTCLKAYDAFARFDGRNPRAWLFTIMRHLYVSQRRHDAYGVDLTDGTASVDGAPSTTGGSVEADVLAHLEVDALEDAILLLPEPMRLAVVLADIEGLSYEEIASVMECPAGTVMSRLHRGRRQLIDALTAVDAGARGRRADRSRPAASGRR